MSSSIPSNLRRHGQPQGGQGEDQPIHSVRTPKHVGLGVERHLDPLIHHFLQTRPKTAIQDSISIDEIQ